MLAFVALDDFFKQKLAFVDKNQAQLTCFQQSDVKINYQTRSGILKHCDEWVNKIRRTTCLFTIILDACYLLKLGFNVKAEIQILNGINPLLPYLKTAKKATT